MSKITRFKDIPCFISDGDYSVDYPLNYFINWIKEEEKTGGLELNPDFQRGHIWTEAQQIAFLEFFLRGGKSGRTVYFNHPTWMRNYGTNPEYNDFVCVDGLQRITAIRRFIDNEIPVFGSYYKEFTDRIDMTQRTIRVNIHSLKTKREVLQWYIEMNAGGTPHTNEEIEKVQELLNKNL